MEQELSFGLDLGQKASLQKWANYEQKKLYRYLCEQILINFKILGNMFIYISLDRWNTTFLSNSIATHEIVDVISSK